MDLSYTATATGTSLILVGNGGARTSSTETLLFSQQSHRWRAERPPLRSGGVGAPGLL